MLKIYFARRFSYSPVQLLYPYKRLRQVKQFAPNHMASKWWAWLPTPVRLTSTLFDHTLCLVFLPLHAACPYSLQRILHGKLLNASGTVIQSSFCSENVLGGSLGRKKKVSRTSKVRLLPSVEAGKRHGLYL